MPTSTSLLFNIPSMITQSQLRTHNKALTTALERLSTGSQINSAKDNPAKNYEAGNANSAIKNTDQAKRNSQDGAALLQIAEGTCNEVQAILQRVRELSVQAANDTLSSAERHYLHSESTELLQEMDRIVMSSTYNAKQIFGDGKDSVSGVPHKNLYELRKEYDEQVTNGTTTDTFEDWKIANTVDPLKEWNPFAGTKEIRAGILHIGPSVEQGKYHDPNEVKVSIPELSTRTLGLDTLSLTYQNGATKAIDDVDLSLSGLSTLRTYMGSIVNRMDAQVDTLEDNVTNLSDQVTKIKDADFAKESTALATAQIQQQAAMSILAQGNSRVTKVLEILGR